jgi:DNA-binding IclR family transcriptional regulator
VLRELEVSYIEKQPGPRPVSAFAPAATLPAHPTALGRVLLAFGPASAIEMTIIRGLRPYTPHTVTSPDRFRRALTDTRLTRVAVTRSEFEIGAVGVAMPVFGPGGDVVAAIELTVHHRLGRELQPVMPALAVAARSLSRELADEAHREQAERRPPLREVFHGCLDGRVDRTRKQAVTVAAGRAP